jgi:hypothetical protein
LYGFAMTQLLEQAFQKLQRLCDEEQDAIAERILLELDERRWTELFATPESQSYLEEIGAKALAERKAGETRALSSL